MLFVNLGALLALVASTQAFVIPEGATDGVYTVTRDATGADVHTKIASAEASIEARGSGQKLESRSAYQIWCGCGFNMNPGSTDAAVADLKNQLGGGASVPARQSYYSIRSGVVAFACSRRDGPTVLSGGTYAASLESITRSCGLYIAGAQELNIPIIVGYQRYANGDNFCGSSTSSPANRC